MYGEDWKERFVVWDNSAGTNNLTRDYRFKELYTSTLEQSDIDTSNQMGYNPGAVKFQFDFLNDPDEKLPQGLQEALNSGKEVLFFINPPYATANNMGTKEGSHKGGVSTTAIGQEMRDSKEWGASTQQLYAQFLYRIWKYRQINKNIHIALFCPPLYLTGSSFKKFRSKFFNSFGFEKGFLFQASHFSDVSAEWGINLAVLSNKPNNNKDFIHELVEVNGETFDLEGQGKKVIYNLDKDKKASDWVREEIKGLKTFDFPQMTSALNVKSVGKTLRGRAIKNHLGYFLSASNNIYENVGQVSMFSSVCSKGNGLSITKENILKTTSLFTARKSIKGNWINDKDEYLAPNEKHPNYRQFEVDSLVYSLFNNSSQQSSLRQVDYKDKKWNIKNEFFWLSKEAIIELAEKEGNNQVYQDAKYSDERHVYKLLEEIYPELSEEAKTILEMGTELLKKTFPYRGLINEEHPEYHINTWDAGYAQIKLLSQKFFPEEHKAFRDKYNAWSDSLVPMVYELGFLK